jgi:hypothetical protein
MFAYSPPSRHHLDRLTPRSKNIHPRDFEATTKSKYDTFNKGATTTPPPSHVHNGPGFHPWTSTLGGKHDAPNRESGANGVAVAKGFAQGPTSANVEPRSQTPHRPTPSNAAALLSHGGLIRGQRRAGCTLQPHSCIDRHPLRPGNTWGRSCLHRLRDTAARRGHR